jgi:RNA polymerase sigma-70 factor (ECF subfamily)
MPDLNETPQTRIHGRVQGEGNVVELRRERKAVERQSFEGLFLDQHDRLYRALYFITGSPDDAEELMQDAFLKLWERWDSIGVIEDPVAWLFRVSLNGFRMRARRARVAARRLVPHDQPSRSFRGREHPRGRPADAALASAAATRRARAHRDLRLQLGTGRPNSAPVLRTVPVAGGKSTLLIGPSGGMTDAGNGSLSPDGSLVTFLGGGFPLSGEPTFHCGPCRLVANVDGTERRVIPGHVSNPAGTWSPDGSRIVDLSCHGVESAESCSAPYAIIVVDIATGDPFPRVADGVGAIWLDDHTLLIDV